jgi:hypothetical protein
MPSRRAVLIPSGVPILMDCRTAWTFLSACPHSSRDGSVVELARMVREPLPRRAADAERELPRSKDRGREVLESE